jgi:hypothetical protein
MEIRCFPGETCGISTTEVCVKVLRNKTGTEAQLGKQQSKRWNINENKKWPRSFLNIFCSLAPFYALNRLNTNQIHKS